MPFGRTLTPETVKRFRADFLLLLKNLKRIKDYQQALAWHEAMQRWRNNFDKYIESAIKELGRFRSDELSPSLAKVWAHDLRRYAHPLVHEMYSSPLTRYELADRYTYRPHDRKDVEEQLHRDFERDAPKWDRRVKRVAREVWKNLDSLLTSMQHSWEDRGLKGLDVPQEESFQHLGFHVTLVGYSDRGYGHRESVGAFKAALKHYRERAKKVYPWLLRYQLPMTLSFEEGLGAGGRYMGDGTIMVNGLETNVKRQAHVVAHEMGHHIFKVVLSKADRDYWDAAVHGSKGPLDLREVVRLPGSDFIALDDDLRRRDPILALRLETMIKDDMGGGGYRGRDLATKTDIQEYLDAGGDPVIQVTTEPITGYAAKNTEEAFCEALGLLVAYGPRTVLPVVRRRLKAILPQLKVTARIQASKAAVQEATVTTRRDALKDVGTASLMDPGVDDAALVVSHKYAKAYGRFLSKGGMGKLPALMPIINREAKTWKGKFTSDDLTREYIKLQASQMSTVHDREGFAMSTGLTTLTKQPYKGLVEQLIKTGRVQATFKKRLIAAMLRARRPDLANVVAHLVIALSVPEAMKLLDVTDKDLGDKASLKNAYRKASMKHHPDRGGDLETMKLVNEAYKLLQRSGAVKLDRQEVKRREDEAVTIIKMALNRTFNPKVFTEHFEKTTGQKYTLIVTPKHAGTTLHAEWSAVNADTVFTLNVSGSIHQFMWGKPKLGGGDPDISFPIQVWTTIFHGNRKVKMAQRDWSHTDKHRVIMDPKELFPPAKIKKMMAGKERARKFSKRDMILGLEKKLGARVDHGKQVWAYVPIGKEGEELTLAIYRSTMMRTAVWDVNGVYKKHRRMDMVKGSKFMMEGEEVLVALIAMQKRAKSMDDPGQIAALVAKTTQDVNKAQMQNPAYTS